MVTNDPRNMNAVLLGKKGGEATRNKYGIEYLKELSKKGVEAKKAKKQQNSTGTN